MAGKCDQPMGQVHGTLHRVARNVHVGFHTLQPPLLQASLQQFEAATDTGQQVVHFMAHAARQLANHLHTLTVVHQRLCLTRSLFTVCGDVPANRRQQVAVKPRTPAKPVVVTIAVSQADLQLLRVAALEQPGHCQSYFGTLCRVHQLHHRHCLHLLLCPAQNAVPGRVGSMQFQFRGEHHHRFARQQPELLSLGHMLLNLAFKALHLLTPMAVGLDAGRGLDHRMQKPRHVTEFIVQGA